MWRSIIIRRIEALKGFLNRCQTGGVAMQQTHMSTRSTYQLTKEGIERLNQAINETIERARNSSSGGPSNREELWRAAGINTENTFRNLMNGNSTFLRLIENLFQIVGLDIQGPDEASPDYREVIHQPLAPSAPHEEDANELNLPTDVAISIHNLEAMNETVGHREARKLGANTQSSTQIVEA